MTLEKEDYSNNLKFRKETRKNLSEQEEYGTKVDNIPVRLCLCPGSQPGKIIVQASAHELTCSFRKRLAVKGFTVDTSVTPKKFTGGFGLGVALSAK